MIAKKEVSLKKTTPPKHILNCRPSKAQENDWTMATAQAADVIDAPAALPQSVDLRESWWKINDQGSTGSCVGWATADSLLRWHFTKAGKLARTALMSVRFIWMASKETDEFTSAPTTFIESDGTSLKAALDVARNYGSLLDADLPFGSGQLFQGDENTCYAKASRFKIRSYYNLQPGDTLRNWKNWLATNGPILVRLNVDATWDHALSTHGNLDAYANGTGRGGHAVSIVGYTADRFIVRNSWGTTNWGDGGFAYASYAYAKAAFTESYGIVLF